MNDMLPQVLAELNLQPGQCRRVQVNGYQLEIRRPADGEADFADMAMLQPWAEFPDSGQAVTIPVRYAPHPLPVPPDIRADEDESA
jgi:hypothetical protein